MSFQRLLAPRAHCSLEIPRGDVLRLTVVDGQQVPDFVFFHLEDHGERLSPTATQLTNGTFVIGEGQSLYSNRGRELLQIVRCTVNEGVIVGGSCSEPANYARFGVRDTPNCRTNLIEAGAPYGLEEPDIGHIYCPFMTMVPAPDGSYVIDLPKCDAGDYVELRAVLPVLALVSNCPQERAPTNAYEPSRLHVWVGAVDDPRPDLSGILADAEVAHA
jgi:uncharacterized protein YcgI (DUF1989 family)